MDFSGRVAIVTGGASGMGAATARLLGERGARVAVVDRNESGAASVVAKLADGIVVGGDVADSTACERAIRQTVEMWGRIDVLVNAAGVIVRAPAAETSDEDWQRIFSVNVDGVFYMSRAAIPPMRDGGGGAIVNFGSVWGRVGSPGAAAYCATKGAVHQLTRAMALEHARQGIRINAVAPGEIETPMLASERSEPPTREFLDQLGETVPMGRLGQAEEVAEVVAFLASSRASYVNGTIFPVDAAFGAR